MLGKVVEFKVVENIPKYFRKEHVDNGKKCQSVNMLYFRIKRKNMIIQYISHMKCFYFRDF